MWKPWKILFWVSGVYTTPRQYIMDSITLLRAGSHDPPLPYFCVARTGARSQAARNSPQSAAPSSHCPTIVNGCALRGGSFISSSSNEQRAKSERRMRPPARRHSVGPGASIFPSIFVTAIPLIKPYFSSQVNKSNTLLFSIPSIYYYYTMIE